MNKLLINKLVEYIRANNPDVLLLLQENGQLSAYLHNKISSIQETINVLQKEGKPSYIIEEDCLKVLTSDLRPSKYNYLKNILENEFGLTCERLLESGVLTYEVINLIDYCKPVFDRFDFSEVNEENPYLRYAIVGEVNEYLNQQ